MDLLLNRRRAMLSALEVEEYIIFADPVVEQICANQWGDGIGLKPSQAARVTSLADVFKENTTITSFDELQYFTSLTALGTSATITQNTHSQFYGCTALTSITFPPSLTMIGSYSFYGCTSLSNINGLESVTVLGREAFVNCTSLSIEVNLPNLTAIYNAAFKASAITKVLSLGSITALTCSNNYGVFQACTALTSVVLPNTLTNIQQYSFYGCTNLASINFPASITTIGTYAFYSCTTLESVTLPTTVTSINNFVFYGCTKLTSVQGLTNVTYIGASAFKACSSLTTISTPSVLTFDTGAFEQCTKLVYVDLSSATAINYGAFQGCTQLSIDLDCPNLTGAIGSRAFGGTAIKKVLNLGSITQISGYAFSGCKAMTEIHLPATLTTISMAAIEVSNTSATPMLTVYSYNTTPPSYGRSCFRADKVSVVYVPSESVSSYQTTWSALSSKIQAMP